MAQTRTTTSDTLFDGARKLSDGMIDSARTLFHAGLGVMATTEEQVRETFDRMVDRGKRYDEDDKGLLSRASREAKDVGDWVEERVQGTVSAVLGRAGIPSRDEIHKLTDRVETLTRKVDALGK